jgi:hypothetical protein
MRVHLVMTRAFSASDHFDPAEQTNTGTITALRSLGI